MAVGKNGYGDNRQQNAPTRDAEPPLSGGSRTIPLLDASHLRGALSAPALYATPGSCAPGAPAPPAAFASRPHKAHEARRCSLLPVFHQVTWSGSPAHPAAPGVGGVPLRGLSHSGGDSHSSLRNSLFYQHHTRLSSQL